MNKDLPDEKPVAATVAGQSSKSKRGRAPAWPSPRLSAAAWERRRLERRLDKPCFAAPRRVQARNEEQDCVRQMSLYRSRPEVLASALLAMGITESGDEMPEYQERTE